MPIEKSKELELLGFLEKSHCVPILIALDKNGMMNRNQIYHELAETIRIVIKRIELLKEYGLIYEIKMQVKPYAKCVDLTIKGKKVASRLSEIKDHMEAKYSYPVSLCHFSDRPNYPKEIEEILAYQEFVENDRQKALDVLNELSSCPKCGNTLHMFRNTERIEWTCFVCGFKKEATHKEWLKIWAFENVLNHG